MKTIIYTKSFNGHRKSYATFVSNLIDNSEVSLKPRIFTKNTNLFFLMVDDGFFEYFIHALIRKIFGYNTVGLYFRINTISKSNSSLHYRIRRILLKVSKKFKIAKTISIVPFYCHSNSSEYFDSFIYDFQFWDLSKTERRKFELCRLSNKEPVIPKSQSNQSKNKKKVFSLGSQNRLKGLDKFLLNYIESSDLRNKFQFVFAGKAEETYIREIEMFVENNGVCINRMISEDELIECYAQSDVVWTHYAKDYDQASGIFGRAIQLGIPPLVREDSLIHLICQKEGIAHIALSDNEICNLIEVEIPNINVSLGEKIAERFRQVSLNNLRLALALVSDEEDA